ncbi:MAG: hypothetical protein QOJ66_578, partial [Ilumatobacteraceae bacterium]
SRLRGPPEAAPGQHDLDTEFRVRDDRNTGPQTPLRTTKKQTTRTPMRVRVLADVSRHHSVRPEVRPEGLEPPTF